MKILFLTYGNETVASSRTRVFQYLPYLKSQNHSTSILIYENNSFFSPTLYRYGIFLAFLLLIPFYEVVFIQKVLFGLPVIRFLKLWIKIFRKIVVFDFDDAIFTTPKNVKIREQQLSLGVRFRNTVRLSDLVVLENAFNKSNVENLVENILVITGPIDTNRYHPRVSESRRDVVIGWIGSPSTTMYLEPLIPILFQLQRKYPHISFKTIGASPITFPGLRIKQVPWNLQTEVPELHEFDIGVMPLTDDEWSQGKGGYKILQYMALGIPAIASPVGVNSELIVDGHSGFLPLTIEDWRDKLDLLGSSEKFRMELGKFGRQLAIEKYSFEVSSPRLFNAISKLLHSPLE